MTRNVNEQINLIRKSNEFKEILIILRVQSVKCTLKKYSAMTEGNSSY